MHLKFSVFYTISEIFTIFSIPTNSIFSRFCSKRAPLAPKGIFDESLGFSIEDISEMRKYFFDRSKVLNSSEFSLPDSRFIAPSSKTPKTRYSAYSPGSPYIRGQNHQYTWDSCQPRRP